jgi:hypothetical protein
MLQDAIRADWPHLLAKSYAASVTEPATALHEVTCGANAGGHAACRPRFIPPALPIREFHLRARRALAAWRFKILRSARVILPFRTRDISCEIALFLDIYCLILC